MASSARPVYRYNFFVACATFFLILAGGLVTSHQAGLSVPDWPKSFGTWFPPMQGLMIWEHGHRVIAAFVGLLSLTLAVWITLSDKRKWLIGLAWSSIVLVFLQALLGGLTVLLKLPPAISISHAVIGQTFFGLLVATAFFLSPYYEQNQDSAGTSRDPKLARLALIGLGMVYLQLILGAAVRHTDHGVIEHIVFAALLTGHLLAFSFYALYHHPARKVLIRLVACLGATLVTQVFLGVGAFSFKVLIPETQQPTAVKVLFTAFHQSVGAVVLALLVLLWLVALHPERNKA